MSTQNYKTKSDLTYRNMPKITGNNQYTSKLVIGLDGGYSSAKCITANKAIMFPSYAKKVNGELEAVIKTTDSFNYQYRDNLTGEHWVVGQLAEAMLDSIDLERTTDASIYGRYHYSSEMFKVQMASGIGLALYGQEKPNEIFLQTGLPSEYKERDSKKMLNALCGDYNFSIRIGTALWQDFVFTLDEQHVFIMEQPQGTLVGIAYGNGEVDGKKILRSNTIIYDIGFGTEDTFSIRNGFKSNLPNTYTDTAMKSVLELCIRYIQKDHPVDLKIFEMQKYLESGQIPYYDFDDSETPYKYVNIAPYLEKASDELCKKSIQRLLVDYDNLIDYQYLIVTGGTGEERFERIKDMLSGLKTLTVLPGNSGDESLPFTYSNAMGYYLFRQKAITKKGE